MHVSSQKEIITNQYTFLSRQSLIDKFQKLKNNSIGVGLIINKKKTKYLKNTKKKKPEMKD
jgi:hypothetical protein